MTGSDPLEVKFINLSTGYVNRWQWNFGDGSTSKEKEPTHSYDKPGTYTVKLMAYYSTGIDSITRTNFIQVHQKESFARLEVINSTPTLPESDCSNAIDGDLYGWDGTTVLQGKQPSIILNLQDSANKKVCSIGLLTDTGVGYEDRWIRRFQVQISNSGIEPGSFQTILDTAMTTGEMEVFSIQPIQAKYVKLVVVAPQTNFIHLGEFQVFYGEGTTSTVLSEETSIPNAFRLAQNYPNPFNPETYIKYTIPKEGDVTINIYDVRGRLVRKLVDEHKPAGYYQVTWDARNDDGVSVSNGIYLVCMKSRTFTSIKKMTLLK